MKRSLMLITALAGVMSAPALADTKSKNWKHSSDGQMPERWSLDSPDYALCDAGLAQSPIDLGAANARGHLMLGTNYGPARGKIALGDAKVQVDFDGGQKLGMTSGSTAFKLLQVHFHTPAEHAIDGKRLPLAGHLVHASADGKLAVLGMLFTEGRPNPALAQILAAKSNGNGTPINFDVKQLLPSDMNIYRYMGSLTTPPCSEGVNWHVLQTPVEASARQIAMFRQALGQSARSIQPAGNRLIVEPAQ